MVLGRGVMVLVSPLQTLAAWFRSCMNCPWAHRGTSLSRSVALKVSAIRYVLPLKAHM